MAGGCAFAEPLAPGNGRVTPQEGPRLEKVAEYPLEVTGASGIAFEGGSRFHVLRDHNEKGQAEILPLDLVFDPKSGAVVSRKSGRGIPLAGNRDSEGIAFDAARGVLWVSDEEVPSIRAFGFDGTARGGDVPIPEIQKREKVANRSLEALGIFGNELWTCNEEALRCDGERSSALVGTVVRLMRYVRSKPSQPWRSAGTWPYRCARSAPAFGPSQTGVSGICALDDGSLLVLEREVSALTWGRCEIYRVTPEARAAATDVSTVPSLAKGEWKEVRKGRPLISFTGGRPDAVIVYEGICAGPRLADGSQIVCLVSDGGETRSALGLKVTAVARLCVLRYRPF